MTGTLRVLCGAVVVGVLLAAAPAQLAGWVFVGLAVLFLASRVSAGRPS